MNTLDEFKERVLTDKEFVKKFGDAKDKEEILKIARSNGYNFTRSDLKSKELDDVLEQVAGGATTAVSKKTMVVGSNVLIFNDGGNKEQYDNWMTNDVLGGKTFDEWLAEQEQAEANGQEVTQ